ncbi:MAG: ZIP family metal transporter [Clostridiales bacterium]|nr:ZIP family metal transporter [Clostridiales bacterium]
MRSELYRAALAAMVAGVAGTGLGGLWAFMPGSRSNGAARAMLLFASGLMTAVVCFELIPEALALSGLGPLIAGIVSGVAAVALLSALIPGEDAAARTGWLVAASIALHNLPEGLAIGAGYAAFPALGIRLALVIALHDLPEGLAAAAPLRTAGVAPWRVFLLCALTGVPTGVGGLLGAIIGRISARWVAVSMGFAGGAMLYVTCGEMLPLTQRMGAERWQALWQIAGFAAGLLASSL